MYLFSVRYCRRLFFVATPDASSITLASVMSVGKESRFPRRAEERGLEGIRQKQY